jgi:hypothetical protein
LPAEGTSALKGLSPFRAKIFNIAYVDGYG